MKKHILTGLGVLLLGTSMAVAAPQQFQQRSNFNDSPAYQVQQQRPDQRYQSQQQYQRVTARQKKQLKRKHHSKKQLRQELRRERSRR